MLYAIFPFCSNEVTKLRIEQIYYFVKIADLHSFSAANTELFVSQQALSTAIKNLEDYFHTQFFIRTPKGVSLSEDGEYYYEIATKILALHEQAYNHFLRQPSDSDSIKIALNSNVKNWFFPKIVSYFLSKYPSYPIEYIIVHNDDVISLLQNDEVDIGVLPILSIDNKALITLPSNLTFTSFNCTHYSLLTSTQSPLANFKSISMSTIVKYPIILSSDYSLDLFNTLIYHYCDNPNIITVDSLALQQQMVEDNLGNKLFLASNPCPNNHVCKIPILNNITICVGFLTSDKPLSTFQELFIEKAKNLIAKS